jgi:hypothetical protein
MPSLIIAFSLAIGAVIGSVLLLTAVGVPKEIAGPISTAIMGSVPFIRDNLERRKKLAKSDRQKDQIVSIKGYGLPMTRLILYGWLFMFAGMGFGSAVGGVIGGITDNEIVSPFIPGKIVAVVTICPVVFLIGRWIGKRYISHGVLTVIVTASITHFSMSIIDIIFVSKPLYEALFDIEKSIESFILILIRGTIFLSTIGLIGFWRGRQQRLAAYLDYLMRQVSQNARKAIVELAYEEAKKSSQEIVKSRA